MLPDVIYDRLPAQAQHQVKGLEPMPTRVRRQLEHTRAETITAMGRLHGAGRIGEHGLELAERVAARGAAFSAENPTMAAQARRLTEAMLVLTEAEMWQVASGRRR